MSRRHGTVSAYRRGCRCDACRAVKAGYQKRLTQPASRDVEFFHVCPCGCREIIPIQWADCRAVVVGAGDSPQGYHVDGARGSASHRASGVPTRLENTGPDQGAPAPTAPFRPGVAATVPNSGGPGRPPT